MPMSITEISTPGRTLPMVWWEQEQPAPELGIVLPGRAFGGGPPPTMYATLALEAAGADVAWVNYSYDRDPEFDRLDQAGRERRLFEDVTAGIEAALARSPRRSHVVVGKSLGTTAMGRLLAEGGLPAGARTIWLTPVLDDPRVRSALETLDQPGLVVIGDRDPYFDAGLLNAIARRETCRVLVLEGADHGLAVYRDLPATARAAERYLAGLASFLGSA